jgi:hypothetical protein
MSGGRGAGWACGNCTYINTDDDDACAVCGTPSAKRNLASSGVLAVAEGRVRATRHQIADDNSCLFHAVALFCIIATKLHYTVDVFAANFLVVAVWRFYHHAVASERVKEQYGLLQWMEAEEVLRIDHRAYNHWKRKGVLSEGVFHGWPWGKSESDASTPPPTPGTPPKKAKET